MLSEVATESEDNQSSHVSSGCKQFALHFYNTIAEKNQNENIFFSPLGIHAVLSMIYPGSEQDTRSVLADTLHVADPDKTAEGYSKIIKELNSVQNVTLHIANKIYLKSDYKLQKDYVSTIANKFHSETDNTINFAADSEAAAKTINSWVNEKTAGKIPTLFEPSDFSEDTRLVLVNAIYFKGDWEDKFDKGDTRTEPFYLNGVGTKMDVQMMHRKGKYNYKVDEQLEAQVVELPYKGSDITVVVVLPSDVNGIGALESKIQDQGLGKVLDDLKMRSVSLALPKFQLATKIDLKNILIQMGLNALFSKQMCNLQKMIDADEQLYVSSAVQKAVIEVNEEGAEAASVTEATASEFRALRITKYQVFYADHPFLVIMRKGDIILFYGRIMKPTSADSELSPRSEPNREERPLVERVAC